MIKNISALFAKKGLLTLSLLTFLAVSSIRSQVNINIGTGTAGNTSTGYPCPIQDEFEGSRMQFLYKASELQAAGMSTGLIYSVSFNVTAINTATTIDFMQVKVGNTAATSLSTTAWDDFVGATSNTATTSFTAATGYKVFAFTSPFFWDGTSNLLIEICTGDPANGTSTTWTANPTVPFTTGLSFNGSHTFAQDDNGSLCNTTSTANNGSQTSRPNIRFSWQLALPCSGVPAMGTATATPTTVCVGKTFNLTVAGVPVASGLSYQWEKSPDGVSNWDTVANAKIKNVTLTQTATSYYRLKIKCTNTNDSVYSNTVLVNSPALLGGIYTIDKGSAPSATNFISFNAAYSAIKCGISSPVTFNVVPGSGPYTEQLLINGIIPFSSPTNTITFNGNGESIKFTGTTTNERAVIKLKGAKYFIFDSLTVDASTTTTFGIGFQLLNDADSNIIRKCNILAGNNVTAGNTAGIVIGGLDANAIGANTASLSDDNIIDRNTISGGVYGFVLAAGALGDNGRNVFTNNTVKDFYQYGCYATFCYLTTIEGNNFSRPSRATVGIFNGIYFTGTNIAAQILRNRIFSPFGGVVSSTQAFNGIVLDNANAGVSPTTDEEYKVYNNLVYDVRNAGAQTGLLNTGTSNVQFVHNTISLDDKLSTATTATKGYGQTGTANSITFVNNLVTISRGGTGTKHCISVTTAPVFADNNNYYNAAVAGTNYVGFYLSNRLSLLDWQTAMKPLGNDQNSIEVDPGYKAPLPVNKFSDYHPENAGMNNKGNPYGLLNDILNSVRSLDTPDIGCYEFVPPPCNAGSLGGTTKISVLGRKVVNTDTTVCEGTYVKLGVNIPGTYGSSQTFQWQRVKDLAFAPDTFTSASLVPDTSFLTNDTSYYYRCKMSCDGMDLYTNWRKVSSFPAMIVGDYYINGNIPTNYIAGAPGGTFNKYDTAVRAMQFCGIKGTPGNVVFNVVPITSGNPYTEQVKIDSVVGADVTRQVVFKGHNTVLTFPAGQPTNSNERALIKLTRADFINFDSLTIDASNGSTYGYGVQMLKDADSNSIRHCNIICNSTATSQNYNGIVINNTDAGVVATGNTFCDGNLIDSNTITGGYYGITLVGGTATGVTIDNNTISHNRISDFYSTGLFVAGTRGTLIDHNTFDRPTRASVAAGTGVSFATSPSFAATISNNRFTNFYGGSLTGNTGTYGINFNGVDATTGNENLVYNNAFYNLNGLGLVYALYNNSSDNVFYYHNSISLDNPGVAATGVAAGFYQTVAATGLRFKNNIIHITRGGNAVKHCINLNTATSATGFESNTNVLYVDPTVVNGHIGFLTSNKTTMQAWQNAQSPKFDSLSFNYDPLYVDAVNGNLKPQFYLIDNKAENLAIPTDILDNPRNVFTPDIGAWEFVPPPCPSPLLAGVASVTPSSGICLEVPVKLTLAGSSPVGQVYFQWQDSIQGGNWQNLGPLKYSPTYDTLSSVRTFYRCIVTCAATGASVISTVAVETLSTVMPGLTYTIDSSKPTDYSGKLTQLPVENFQTFGEAILAMQCGILGPVVFDVQKGTYNEQARIPYVPGASATNTITFQGNNGIATDKILTWGNGTAVSNYVLRFDSSNYVTFKNITINNTNTTNGRVVDFINNASKDGLLNCVINTPATLSSANTQSAIFSSPTKGTNITIKGNTITGGSNGIYFAGTSGNATSVVATTGHLIDSNTISGNYGAGIFVKFTNRLKVSRNHITYNAPSATGAAGIFADYCDSALVLLNNKVDINNTNAAINGIQVQNSRSITAVGISTINGNEVYANTGNTGSVNGIYTTTSDGLDVKNNVIAINSASVTGAYGLTNFNNTNNISFYHNTVSVSVVSTTSAAAQLTQSTSGKFALQNNIFSNTGGGRAIYMSNFSNFNCDYNMLYTTGANLVNATTNYPTIGSWRSASGRDKWSIIYAPAFVSLQDLHPDLTNPDVWAMHGRAIQQKNDTSDINGNYRPDSLQVGVPDLGAYEFLPPSSTQPTVLSAIPATPSANTEQVFYYGSDTVMRIKWNNFPPPSVEIRRFSGVGASGINPRPGTPPLKDSMYFYTQVEIPGGGNYIADVKLYYIDPWLGSIPSEYSEYQLGLGKTNPAGKWNVGFGSRNDVPKKAIYESTVGYLDKFTGLYNPYAPPPPACGDSSNEGREFWVAYPANQLAGTQNELYLLYLSAKEAAYVTVTIPCINWQRTYNIPAGNVQVTAQIPYAVRHNNSGLYCDGIRITSDMPIVAYAHCSGAASSGATMLMPICTWGYEYKMLSRHQNWGGGSFASYFMIAKEDNTKISYSSSVATSIVPQTDEIVLNKGEWFQVIAASGNDDLSGSVAKSIPNSKGVCIPFGFFSGDTRTLNSKPCGGGGDFMIAQNFPASAWGKKYLTARTSQSTSAHNLQSNLIRIALKDINQSVWINNVLAYQNGVVGTAGIGVTGLTVSTTTVQGTTTPAYVEFLADSACYIYSDRPMMVAQFLSGACAGVGDPDMSYISPLEQGVNKVSFYRNTVESIDVNVLTLIGSTNDIPKICEGVPCTSLTWDKIYPHWAYPGKSVYVKHWPTSAQRQVTVSGDSTFTALTYGLGSVESYMYNAGTLIRNIAGTGKRIINKNDPDSLNSTSTRDYTCGGGTNFQIGTVFPVTPDSITWRISKIPGIHPNTDITLKKPYNPPPKITVTPKGDSLISFTLPDYYYMDNPGYYTLIVKWWHPDIEGCDKKREDQQYIQVVPTPKIGFNYAPTPICPKNYVNFLADSTDAVTGIKVLNYHWTSQPYNNAGTTKDTTFYYATAGVDSVKLQVQMQDYCTGDSTILVTINPNPTLDVVADSINVCAGANGSFNILTPLTGATYSVFATPTGGSSITSGNGTTPFTFNNITSDVDYFVEVVSATNCVSVDRKKVRFRVTQIPTAIPLPASDIKCIGTTSVFTVSNPIANGKYYWFDAATAGNKIDSGTVLTINPVTTSATYHLEVSLNGCVSTTRFPVSLTAATSPSLAVVNNAITVCNGDAASFAIASPDATVTYNWYTAATGGTVTNGTSYTINPATTSAPYFVSATSANNCTTSPRLQVDLTVTQRPVVTVIAPVSVTVCKGNTQVFTAQSSIAGATYNWYSAPTGGTPIFAGAAFTTPAVNNAATYYVEGVNNTCASVTRATVTVDTLVAVDTFSVKASQVYPDKIIFDWRNNVAGAVSYQISIDGGATFSAVSGPGTQHIITPLPSNVKRTGIVKALGANTCQDRIADSVVGRTVLNATYYPNVFSPNASGDPRNERISICGASISKIQYLIFNQWGQKIWSYEATDPIADSYGCIQLWDGKQYGVLQPSGVYVFASHIVFKDGTVEDRKGTINLIR